MDLDYIESLAELLAGSRVCELTVRRGEDAITLRRQPGGRPLETAPVARTDELPAAIAAEVRPAPDGDGLALPVSFVTPTALVPIETAAENGLPDYEVVRARRVGVFWRGSGPDGDALVRIGDWIPARGQLGSIESMCLFDEIDSPAPGVVVGIFVESGAAVEYGQPLFHLERRERPPDLSVNGDTP